MSTRGNNRNYESIPMEDPNDQVEPLHLYYVRMQDGRNKLTISMKFDDETVPFTEGKQMYDKSLSGPFIYLLDFHVRMSKEKLWIQYRLELSYPGTLYGQSKFAEIRNEGHSLKDYFTQKHVFHFGIRFPPRSTSQISGKKHQRLADKNH